MRYAIISDIHGNLEALNEVLRKIDNLKIDKIYNLGDLVGYGPDPDKVIDIILKEDIPSIMGNHDEAVIDIQKSNRFNEYAKKAVIYTLSKLTEEHKSFLESLPLKLIEDKFSMVHASFYYPDFWNYVDMRNVYIQFEYLENDIGFIGHTHIPAVYIKSKKEEKIFLESPKEKIYLEDDKKYIINVGSVGQPRDGDKRASFVVYDAKENCIEFYRVEYNIERVYEKIKKNNLPDFLGKRLFDGI